MLLVINYQKKDNIINSYQFFKFVIYVSSSSTVILQFYYFAQVISKHGTISTKTRKFKLFFSRS